MSTINKGIGSTGYGQAQLVINHPRTLDGRSLYEWTATTSSGNVTADQRNAKRISQKIENTLREIDFSAAMTFYDKINHEYYIVEDGVAIINNLENDTWYVYRNFPALCMIVYKDEVYFGTPDGYIRHVSRDYLRDVGADITCYWESGSMDFGAPYAKKHSSLLWVVLKPESMSELTVTVKTDKQNDYGDVDLLANSSDEVAAGIFDFANLNFDHFTFNLNEQPQTQRMKLKAKNFAWYKLIFSSGSADTTFTVLNVSVRYHTTGMVK